MPSRMGNTDLKSIPLLNRHFSRESLHWVQLMQPANASVHHAVRLWHDKKRFRHEITSVKFLINCWRVDCGRGYVVCQCVCDGGGGNGHSGVFIGLSWMSMLGGSCQHTTRKADVVTSCFLHPVNQDGYIKSRFMRKTIPSFQKLTEAAYQK